MSSLKGVVNCDIFTIIYGAPERTYPDFFFLLRSNVILFTCERNIISFACNSITFERNL